MDGERVTYVVELRSPSVSGEDLSYFLHAVAGPEISETAVSCEGSAHVFIDVAFFDCGASAGRGWLYRRSSDGRCSSQSCSGNSVACSDGDINVVHVDDCKCDS